MQIKTNKGTFKVRYTYEKITLAGKIETFVVYMTDLTGPFTGQFGDEIPNTREAKEKYQFEIIEQ